MKRTNQQSTKLFSMAFAALLFSGVAAAQATRPAGVRAAAPPAAAGRTALAPAPATRGTGRLTVQPLFPIVSSQDDHFANSGGYIHTDIRITKNGDGSGLMVANTHIWEVTQLRGFRGSVTVIGLDETKQRTTFTCQTQNYGVDGRMLGTSDRRETYNERVRAEDLAATRYVAIIQRWNPKNVPDDVHAWLAGLTDVANQLAGLIKAVKTVAVSI